MSNPASNHSRFGLTLDTSFWIIRLLLASFPKIITGYIIVQILTSLIPFAENFYFSKFLDNLIALNKTGAAPWVATLSVLICIRAFKSVIRNFQSYLDRVFGFRLENRLRKLFTFKIAGLDFQHFEHKDTSNLIAKTRDEYQWRFRQSFGDINDFIIQLASFITVLFILIPHYWYLVLIIIIGEIPGFLVDRNFSIASFKLFNDNAVKNRRSWDLSAYLTEKNFLSELRINNSVNFIKNKLSEILDFFTDERTRLRRGKLPSDILTSLLSLFTMTLSLLVVINDIRAGLLTIGMFTFYYQVLRQTGDYFTSAINDYVDISEQTMYISNFRRILELDTIVSSGAVKTGLSSTPKIEFRDVSFKYPGSSRYVYRHFNLTINPKEEIALVGVNGAGKSTLIKLLCRFFDPTEGSILIDGIDLKDLDLNYWYSCLSVLFQEFTVYSSLTLKDNVAISRPFNKTEDTKLISALKKSDALNFVSKYKKGLDTYMSHRYGGEEPSWGQWQKIAISRIFYRDTPIMILDEPTASIDAISEYKIFNRLYKEVSDKTIIIVSHRFSTVRNAGRILVISKGRVIEQGSHDELMKLNGRYAKSFRLQAEGYQEKAASSTQ
ncbi:MAG TPA: ABC transporter ATP-binding protein [Patescibacteria group bacterium]